ncbi:MAG: hypothetical protein VW891_12785, partial [Novosphingobium sp.]
MFLDCPNGRIFNGEAKAAQMLYPLTGDSGLHCLKSARNERVTACQNPTETDEMPRFPHPSTAAAVLATLLAAGFQVTAESAQAQAIRGIDNGNIAALPSELSYADIASMADAAEVVMRAQVRKVSRLKPEQAPGLAPGMARVVVQARTQTV